MASFDNASILPARLLGYTACKLIRVDRVAFDCITKEMVASFLREISFMRVVTYYTISNIFFLCHRSVSWVKLIGNSSTRFLFTRKSVMPMRCTYNYLLIIFIHIFSYPMLQLEVEGSTSNYRAMQQASWAQGAVVENGAAYVQPPPHSAAMDSEPTLQIG